jgi:hypothetical protein
MLKSSEFRNCFTYRYMKGAAHLPKGLCCDTKHNGVYPSIDTAGLHLISGCSRGGHRRYIHDSVVFELHRLIKYAGLWPVREPKGVFHADLPKNDSRPDISIRPSANDFANPSYTHAVITCPIEGSQSCRLVSPSAKDAREQGKAANKAYDGKINHYQKILAKARENNPGDANQPQRKIVPFALESTGLIHPKSVDFLQDLADIANETQKLGSENVMTFFIRSISFAFQRAIGSTLSLRSAKLNSHFRKEIDKGFLPEAIISQVPFFFNFVA